LVLSVASSRRVVVSSFHPRSGSVTSVISEVQWMLMGLFGLLIAVLSGQPQASAAQSLAGAIHLVGKMDATGPISSHQVRSGAR
jgi:hypothetical protein